MRNRVISGCLSITCLLVGSGAPAWQPPATSDPALVGDGRGCVLFVHEQELRWEPFRIPGTPGGLQVKVLSQDARTGAVSLLASYPAGWRQTEKGYHSGAEEVFVLEGELTIGQHTLTGRCYSYIPAGMSHGPISTRHGCLALWFFDRAPDFVAAAHSKPGTRADSFVAFKSYSDENWSSGTLRPANQIPPPLLVKMLRTDPQTGARTWIAGILTGHPRYQWESHPTWEEAYLLEGAYAMGECLPEGLKVGVYGPGGYFFRPAHIAHGGPRSGPQGYAIWFMRTPAPLAVTYSDQETCP